MSFLTPLFFEPVNIAVDAEKEKKQTVMDFAIIKGLIDIIVLFLRLLYPGKTDIL